MSKHFELGFEDGFRGRKNLRLSKIYDLGFSEGLNKRYNENEESILLDKYEGVYENVEQKDN